MTRLDLLTDEDLATRHEPKKRWFNQFVTVYKHGCECAECGKSLSNKPGDVFFSCCPPSFDTEEEARLDAEDVYAPSTGELMADHMGTFST